MIFAFIAIFGLINFYLHRVVVLAYPSWTISSGIVIAILSVSLFAAVFFEKKKMLKASMLFSCIGYSWLGIAGIALFFAGVLDFIQLLVAALDDRSAFHWVFGLTVGATVYGFISANRVSVRKVSVASSKFGDSRPPLKVAQISDMHLGDSSVLERTRKVVLAINRLQPDIVVSTGDLFDGFLERMEPYLAELRKIEAPKGKFAISGNHEVYAGLEKAMELTREAGFHVLRDEIVEIDERLRIVGVEDPASPKRRKETEVLAKDANRFTLLLKHRPRIEQSSVGKFDLQLSGHTHGGQIFPFHFLTRLQYKAKPGLSRISGGSYLYLSRGTGSWGPQIRFLAPPEVTFIEIGNV